MDREQKDIFKLPIKQLSDRKLEVFELTGKENITREIAKKLHLAVKPIKSYRVHTKTKLNIENVNELIVHAVKWAET